MSDPVFLRSSARLTLSSVSVSLPACESLISSRLDSEEIQRVRDHTFGPRDSDVDSFVAQ